MDIFVTKIRQKRCKSCKQYFTPDKPLQSVCNWKCATDHANALRAKKEKKEYIDEKEKQKSRADWIREAQQVFNSYIRARDEKLPCISCGRFHKGQYHAGHYRTTAAAPELRFSELNVWKQCSACNNHKHGNIMEYRIGLIQRIGLDKVEFIEGKHEPKHYSIEELKQIKETYKKKLKEIKNV